MVAELEKEVGEQLATKEKQLKEGQRQLEGKASDNIAEGRGRRWGTRTCTGLRAAQCE